MATYTLYGLTSDRLPPNVSDYRSYKFPESVTVPQGYQGAGATRRVIPLFADAFREIEHCAAQRACDAHFSGLGGGLSLSALLRDWKFHFFAFGPGQDPAAWPANDDGIAFGQVVGTYKATSFAEIGIHVTALRSAAFLAATVLHELAHVAGAPGASAADLDRFAQGRLSRAEIRRLHAAERAVWACGLRNQYKQDVIGAIGRVTGPRTV
jgi:hypothetical protein